MLIKRTLKICKSCGDPCYVFSYGDCKNCSQMRYATNKAKQVTLTQTENGKEAKVFKVERKPIKKFSDKQAKLNRAYIAQNKVYLKFNPYCAARLRGCTGQSTQVHHKKGRGLYLLDETTWLACCSSCHKIIELQPEMAKENGLSLNRLSI